jgi:polysaccharide pyruvyl transferase WcaK-like protein
VRFKRASPEGPTTLIAGFYGQGNLGDEAMLEGMLVLLREALGPFRPVVLSARPSDTELRHGVTAVALQDGTGRLARVSRPWRDLRVVTARSENFVLGGGASRRESRSIQI